MELAGQVSEELAQFGDRIRMVGPDDRERRLVVVADRVPSRRNSGWKQRWKPAPSRLPDSRSTIGRTTSSTVPGASVERNTTTCELGLVPHRAAEIAGKRENRGQVLAAVRCRRRADADQRDFRATDRVARRRSSRRRDRWPRPPRSGRPCPPRRRASCRPRSASSLVRSMSTPTTRWPSRARQASDTAPTYPRPKMLMFMRRRCLARASRGRGPG